MLIINYLVAIVIFVLIYSIEKLFLLWFKKKPLWPVLSYDLLVDAITYTVLSFLLIGIIHIVFKKIDAIGLIWLDIVIYFLIKLIKPSKIFFSIKHKEKIQLKSHHILGSAFLVVALLECFIFNSQAYSDNKNVTTYTNFVCEDISSDGVIENNKITLKNKECIYIKTNKKDFDSIYLSFNNNDMNLYINIFELKEDLDTFTFKQYVLMDPKFDAFGYITLDNMDKVEALKIEFDIDDSRYLNNQTKPKVVVDAIEFDSYFPMMVNPVRLGGCVLLLLICFNFKKMVIDRKVDENVAIYQKLEKVILFGGMVVFIFFIIEALVNSSAYFVKYDQLYLGGTSSNNIYYQQFDAYIKGQLHLDVPVDERLMALSNPYDPSKRGGLTVLWDHAFYKGKYYSYYGHAPIYLVMFPIYWVSGYVPTNLFILRLGVIFSVFAILLAALEIIKLFIKKVNEPLLVLTLIAIAFGSLLFTNTSYEYGAAIYRIPYAYANGFLFLTIYLFIKGYKSNRFRIILLASSALSLVFIVLSRPLEIVYLFLFVPVIIKMIKEGSKDKEQQFIDYTPAIGIVIMGAALVCAMNYLRFDSIFEFGEHYQLTVNDCRTNKLSIDGVLPALYHFFIQPPKYSETEHLLMYRYANENFDTHMYNTCSVGLFFIPIVLLMFLAPFVLHKERDPAFIAFIIGSPLLVFLLAYVNYCFAGVCPRYLLDVAPWAALAGGVIGLKALEKDNGKHPVVPILLSLVLLANIVLSGQYHFVEFDGLRVGDFNGLYSIFKSIFNRYNI